MSHPLRLPCGVLLLALGAAMIAASPAGASGSTAVRCGQTLTTSVKLKADLIDCPGDGLVIGASGITVDLNGHTVDGVSTATDCDVDPRGLPAGIANHGGFDRVTVGNGTIRQFDSGFGAGPSAEGDDDAMSDSRIHDLVVRDARFQGIGLGSGLAASNARNLIDHNDVSRVPCGAGVKVNTGQANRISENRIAAAGTGIVLCCGEDSDGNVAERNRISDTLGSGVAVFISGASRIVGNVITDTGSDAISLLGPSSRDALIAGNVVAGSKFAGIFAENCPDCLRDPAPVLDHLRVVGNRISSVADGIILYETDDAVVQGNSISGASGAPDSIGAGVLLDGVSRSVVRANTISRSGELDGNAGIMISVAPEFDPSPRPADGNLVAGNAVTGQHGDGISVAALASHTTLRGNLASRNDRDGIRVLSASTTLLRNTALGNGAFGIEAVAGVTDGGGNVARGNASTPQCTGVTCR